MTPCGRTARSRQTASTDERTRLPPPPERLAAAAAARPPPVSLPESPSSPSWVGSLTFLPTTALPADLPTRRLPPSFPPLPSFLPFPPPPPFYSSHTIPCHATHYELLTGLFGAAASQAEERASERSFSFVKKRAGKTKTHGP